MRASGSVSGGGYARLRAVMFALAAVAFAACDGDTVYTGDDPSDVPGPTVEIRSPGGGDQVTSGRNVAVEIAASDSLGVTEIELTYRGVTTGTQTFPIVPARNDVVIGANVELPAGATGSLELRATARNGRGGVGTSATVVVPVQASDTITPSIALAVDSPERLELTDSIRATITASDNVGGTGLVRLGLTVLVETRNAADTTRRDTTIFEQAVDLGAPRAGEVERVIVFPAPNVSATDLPRLLELSFHAFAIDSAGNCAATVSGAGPQRLTCTQFRNSTVASAAAPEIPTTVVAGRSVPLPAGSSIRDAAPDVARERLYLSNLATSRVEVLNLRSFTFGSPVAVGSQPWGLHLNRNADTLLVANSGGTSISYVTLAGTPQEIVSQRVHTPNVNLFEIKFSIDATGVQRYDAIFLDFSDRPQHLAQDAFGRLLYSTLPTDAATLGTMRMARKEPGWQQAEVRLLLGRNVTEPDSFTISVINIDSVRVFTSTQGDAIELYDHRNGFPGTIVRSGIRSLQGALDSLTADPESDIIWIAGRFDRTLIGLSDTTFVAASGDRMRVAFGEGARGNGRIFMWEAPVAEISNEITVADLVGNTAEHIVGIDLNQDGTLNTARGLNAAYYFKEDLRLQGHFGAAVAPRGSGTALHPDHPSYANYPPSGPNTLGFVAARQTVKIVDTVHFLERGEIQIRDNIIGPLKVSRPLPGDNVGCSGDNCIVARLYGVTDAGAVVLVEVRGRDIQ